MSYYHSLRQENAKLKSSVATSRQRAERRSRHFRTGQTNDIRSLVVIGTRIHPLENQVLYDAAESRHGFILTGGSTITTTSTTTTTSPPFSSLKRNHIFDVVDDDDDDNETKGRGGDRKTLGKSKDTLETQGMLLERHDARTHLYSSSSAPFLSISTPSSALFDTLLDTTMGLKDTTGNPHSSASSSNSAATLSLYHPEVQLTLATAFTLQIARYLQYERYRLLVEARRCGYNNYQHASGDSDDGDDDNDAQKAHLDLVREQVGRIVKEEASKQMKRMQRIQASSSSSLHQRASDPNCYEDDDDDEDDEDDDNYNDGDEHGATDTTSSLSLLSHENGSSFHNHNNTDNYASNHILSYNTNSNNTQETTQNSSSTSSFIGVPEFDMEVIDVQTPILSRCNSPLTEAEIASIASSFGITCKATSTTFASDVTYELSVAQHKGEGVRRNSTLTKPFFFYKRLTQYELKAQLVQKGKKDACMRAYIKMTSGGRGNQNEDIVGGHDLDNEAEEEEDDDDEQQQRKLRHRKSMRRDVLTTTAHRNHSYIYDSSNSLATTTTTTPAAPFKRYSIAGLLATTAKAALRYDASLPFQCGGDESASDSDLEDVVVPSNKTKMMKSSNSKNNTYSSSADTTIKPSQQKRTFITTFGGEDGDYDNNDEDDHSAISRRTEVEEVDEEERSSFRTNHDDLLRLFFPALIGEKANVNGGGETITTSGSSRSNTTTKNKTESAAIIAKPNASPSMMTPAVESMIDESYILQLLLSNGKSAQPHHRQKQRQFSSTTSSTAAATTAAVAHSSSSFHSNQQRQISERHLAERDAEFERINALRDRVYAHTGAPSKPHETLSQTHHITIELKQHMDHHHHQDHHPYERSYDQRDHLRRKQQEDNNVEGESGYLQPKTVVSSVSVGKPTATTGASSTLRAAERIKEKMRAALQQTQAADHAKRNAKR